ncbi:serine/threonine protein kinase [Limnoglobus roseus]|uniref:Serine/threonine protein kinase n=1 Tax=Limnoglobus roseus TaxID=2598579 RepID=A0A5C1AN26_9BACT|nr:serine/threonine-protein kinase [Limnoglobus roseus]QEL19523.1 serine/threonine protein kinase [Limnoglobus roseus]
MPAPATVDEFLELIQKSGVVDEAKLTTYLNRQKEVGPLPTETNKCAGKLVRDAVLTYFQAEQLLQGKWKRFTIGKYKVLEKLGVGGMGQVFLCEHKLMRRRVAVKVLPASKGLDDASRERFYLEARAVAALDHPNIVRAYDIDQDEGLHFLVMEFVDGVNLQDIVKRGGGPLDPYRACHYIYGSALGLQYASQMGIIHRDIKPGNILVDRTGVVKILDMGLARFFNDEDDSLTKKYDENVLGTADYLAPEQAVDSHTVTIRADLYSLGGTFYYLLTGLPPFPEGSVAQKLLWHQTRDPKPIAQIRPEVPPEIIRVVEKLMMKDPDERYQTPAEVMAALQEFVQSPISPPSEKELPALSPAAMGGTANANRQVTNAPLAGGGPHGVSSSSTTEFRSPFAKSSSGPGSSRAKVVNTPTPSRQETVVAEAPVGVWDSLADDTSPREGAETQRTPKQKSAKKLPVSAPEPAAPLPLPPRRKQYLWAGIAAGVVAFLGIGYAIYRSASGDPVVPQNTQLDYRRLYVTQGKGPENAPTFKSVFEAMLAINKRPEFDEGKRKEGEGPTIVILDESHTESPFTLNASGKLRDLTIQADDVNKPVRWTAKPGTNSKRLLEIRSSRGLTIRGIVFDAENAVDFGLVVTNTQSAVRVEDVTVRGAKRSAIRFENVAGEAGKPITLNRVRVQLSPDGDGGIQFAAPEKSLGAGTILNSGITITNGRIEGPGNAGIVFDTPARDVEISRTRFYNLTHGVLVRQPFPADSPFRLTATNNTFHTIRDGAFFATQDLPPAGTDVNFSRNYFADVKGAGIANVPNAGALPKFKADDNVRDKNSGEGNLPAKPAVADNVTLASAPDDNTSFLRYPKSSPLASWGANKVAVGVPPE